MANKPRSSRKPAQRRNSREADRPAQPAEETFREADDTASNYQGRVNQVRDEPMPASHDDDPRQEAVVRNEEHSHASGGQHAPAGTGS